MYQIETTDGFDVVSGTARHRKNFLDYSTIIGDIVTMGQSMRLDVDPDDIEELLEDRSIELAAKELEHLRN